MWENEPAGAALAAVEARGGSALRYSLEGGGGRFRVNPAAGLLATAAPLDYETQNFYNLTVTAVNMVSFLILFYSIWITNGRLTVIYKI